MSQTLIEQSVRSKACNQQDMALKPLPERSIMSVRSLRVSLALTAVEHDSLLLRGMDSSARSSSYRAALPHSLDHWLSIHADVRSILNFVLRFKESSAVHITDNLMALTKTSSVFSELRSQLIKFFSGYELHLDLLQQYGEVIMIQIYMCADTSGRLLLRSCLNTFLSPSSARNAESLFGDASIESFDPNRINSNEHYIAEVAAFSSTSVSTSSSSLTCIFLFLKLLRLPLLWREDTERHRVQSTLRLKASELGSIYAIGRAVYLRRLIADDFSIQVIESVYHLVLSMDAVLASNAAYHYSLHLDLIFQLAWKRDVLVRSLLSSESPETFPWAHVYVCTNWINDITEQLSELTSESATAGLKISLRNFYHMAEKFWRRPFSHGAPLLWKRGHAYIPSDENGWRMLTALRETSSSFSGSESRRRSTPKQLMDLLCLICTFYWSQTAESAGAQATPATSFNAGVDFSSFLEVLRSQRPPQPCHSNEMVAYSSSGFLISEEHQSGSIVLEVLLSSSVYEKLSTIAAGMGSMLLSPLISRCETTRMAEELREVIALFVRYNAEDILLLREIQSLLWIVDAYSADPSSNNLNVLKQMLTSYAATFGINMGILSSNAGMSRMASLDLSWGVAWHMASSKSHSSHNNQPFSLSILSEHCFGDLRHRTPYALELVLRRTDSHFLSGFYSTSGGKSTLENKITIRAMHSCRKDLYQMQRALVFLSKSKISRKVTLIFHQALEIIRCLRDLLSVSLRESIDAILLQVDPLNAAIIATQLLDLQLDQHKSLANISDLLRRCLQPLLELLSKSSYSEEEYASMRIYLSLLQLHLLCPTSAVDPMDEDATVYSILSSVVSDRIHYLAVLTSEAFENRNMFDTSTLRLVNETSALVEEKDLTGLRVFIRPSEAPKFTSLFFELRDL